MPASVPAPPLDFQGVNRKSEAANIAEVIDRFKAIDADTREVKVLTVTFYNRVDRTTSQKLFTSCHSTVASQSPTFFTYAEP